MNDEEKKAYVAEYKEYRHWVFLAVQSKLLADSDLQARLDALDYAFQRGLLLPNIADLMPRPVDYNWKEPKNWSN